MDDDLHVMKKIFPYFLIDAVWSQYMMALGELGDVPDAFTVDDDVFTRNTFQPSEEVLDCEEILNWI